MHPADEFLMHYGVAGMKWGKRKARTPEEQAASRAKTVKVLKVVGTVAAAAAITAGAIYAGKQLNARAGQKAIADFDNSELINIMQSGKLFSKKVVSQAAEVRIPATPPKPPRQVVKKAAVGLANKAKPHAGKAAQALKPYAQQAAANHVQKVLARKAQKLKDLEEADAEMIANTNAMLKTSKL